MFLSILKNLSLARPGKSVQESLAVVPQTELPKLRYERGGTIVAFVASSRGDALTQIMLEMIKPLRPHCSGVEIIDVLAPDWREKFFSLEDAGIWFVFAPFASGELFWAEAGTTTSPWATAGIPFIRIFGDSPAYFPSRHLQPHTNSINAYIHAEHHEFFMRWLAPKAPIVTLPLFPFDTVAASAVDLDRKADGGIIFPKNGNCPDKLTDYWRERLPHELFVALRSVAEEADGSLDENFDATSAVIRQFADLGIEVSPNPRLICFLTAQIDDYLRRRKSTMIARSLLDLPVTIRGDNWEHIDFSGCRAKYDPDSDFVRTRELLDQSAAILDMSPNSHRSPHDRALRAAGRYTTFLTNRTKFYADNFSEAPQFTFQFTSDSIRECVELALSRPRGTVEMGMRQGSRMRELLTVERYVDQVTTVVDACALACGGRPEGTQEFVRY